MKELFGIDFGTTNSTVVGRLKRNTTKYGDGEGRPCPSLVAISKTTGAVEAVGRDAWDRREEYSDYCEIISSAKMLLGTEISWNIGPKRWTPESVVTELFKGLVSSVDERAYDSVLSEPIVAIPVGFSPEKRKALRRAAAGAGLQIRGFVSEPTAAVFKDFGRVRGWSKVVVFDWGGGTLDVSILGIQGSKIDEIATVSLNLGGDSLNELLAEWAHMQVLREKSTAGPPFSGMAPKYRDKMIVQCEEAKRSFSENDDDIVEISIVRYGEFGPVNIILTYAEFEDIMRPKIEEALKVVDDGVTNRAGLSFEEVGCLIMVGGSSKLRGLRGAMDQKNWSCDIIFPEDSDWHVADGAAALASGTGSFVCAQNVGIRLSDDTLYPLLSAGQSIDHAKDNVVFGLVDDSDSARFVFVENAERFGNRLVNTDRVLGHLTVPAFGFSNEPIHVEAHVDEDLLFRVVAKSEKRGDKHSRIWEFSNLRFSYQLPGEE